MQVLMATSQTQQQRPGDFMFAEEGEIVALPKQCGRGDLDDSCGCERSFFGAVSHKATTTAMVVAIDDLDEDDYAGLLVKAYRASGRSLAEIGEYQLVEEMIGIAAAHPVGTILEKRGDRIQPRQPRPAADV